VAAPVISTNPRDATRAALRLSPTPPLERFVVQTQRALDTVHAQLPRRHRALVPQPRRHRRAAPLLRAPTNDRSTRRRAAFCPCRTMSSPPAHDRTTDGRHFHARLPEGHDEVHTVHLRRGLSPSFTLVDCRPSPLTRRSLRKGWSFAALLTRTTKIKCGKTLVSISNHTASRDARRASPPTSDRPTFPLARRTTRKTPKRRP